MKKRDFATGIVLMSLTCLCGSIFAHDFDLVENEVGDSRLATFCGYSFARPISIDLMAVTNENDVVVSYAIGARIVYKDLRVSHPSRIEWEIQQETGSILNEWLVAYVREGCSGADLNAICESYLRHEFSRNLQAGFPEYVKERIAELPDPSQMKIEAVTIDMLQAEGAFRKELIRRSRGVGETRD